MQEERRVANGTEKRKPSGPFTYGENEDSSFARGELRSRGCRDRSPSGNLDLRRFEDPDENFVHLVNSVPTPSGWRAKRAFLQHRSYLLNYLRVLLLKDLIGGGREHVAGMFHADAGTGNTTNMRSARDAIR